MERKTLFSDDVQPGDFRVTGSLVDRKHPAGGMTAEVAMGDGAFMTIINPQSFVDGGPEWVARYGNIVAIRYTIASLLDSYDYLLSGNINSREATRRLLLQRRAYRELRDKPRP